MIFDRIIIILGIFQSVSSNILLYGSTDTATQPTSIDSHGKLKVKAGANIHGGETLTAQEIFKALAPSCGS